MEFGVQFFPAVGPDQKRADQYWREALELTQLAEQLGFTNVRTVEHYFQSYGGYSPDPLIFLSAAAAMTRSIRLVTGAVLPVFNIRSSSPARSGWWMRFPAAAWRWASRAPSCPTSSRASASRWTRAAPGSMKASSRSGACSRRSEVTAQRPLPQLRERDLAAAPDPEAAAAVLDRGAVHQGVVRECRHARPPPHGDSAGGRAYAEPAADLSRRLDASGASRPAAR